MGSWSAAVAKSLQPTTDGEPDAPQRQLVVIDELQKVPDLLDEAHWLIENRHGVLVLCGSSVPACGGDRPTLLGGRAS
jgi:hypothetical protein